MLLLALTASVRGQQSPQPPVVGRPADFSGLVGFYRISTRVDRTEVAVEQPLTLTVRITGQGPKEYQPVRKRLRLFPPGTERDFFIEALPEKDQASPKANTWEFVYRLRPKHEDVEQVPALKLSYYLPARQRFQSTFSSAIPIEVKPRPAPLPPGFYEDVPDRLLGLAPAEQVLNWTRPPDLRSSPLLAAILLLPPLISAVAYVVWKRRYPAVEQTDRQHRSRAAQEAISRLEEAKAVEAAVILARVAEYLRVRTGFPAAEPTPVDVARHLDRLGVSRALIGELNELLAACNAARFAPERPKQNERLAETAIRLIHALETDPWLARTS